LEILREYGDIADVMEVFGIKRVARYSIRSFITKAITVERAAKIHRVPLDEFIATLRTAVGPDPGSRGSRSAPSIRVSLYGAERRDEARGSAAWPIKLGRSSAWA
jgi:hypothetical protein